MKKRVMEGRKVLDEPKEVRKIEMLRCVFLYLGVRTLFIYKIMSQK